MPLLLLVSTLMLGIFALLPQAAGVFIAPDCNPAPTAGVGGAVWEAIFIVPPLPAGANGVESVCWTSPVPPAGGGVIGNSATPGSQVAGGVPPLCPNNPAALVAGAAPPATAENQVGVDWNQDCAVAGNVSVVSFACGNCVQGGVAVGYVVSFPAAPVQHLAGSGYVRPCNGPCTVGGSIVPIDKLALVIPYIGLASILGAATVLGVVYVKRSKNQGTNND